MITREQVADLRPGDVVSLFRNSWPNGTIVRGPLYEAGGWLYVAEEAVQRDDQRTALAPSYTLTVVSRAPRPLYVNHDRTEPMPGDVARDADGDESWPLWVRQATRWARLRVENSVTWRGDGDLPDRLRLRLLVDGETGQVVP